VIGDIKSSYEERERSLVSGIIPCLQNIIAVNHFYLSFLKKRIFAPIVDQA
jgi:hypothetical protein